MTDRTKGIRALAAILLMVALLGAISRVSAQDADETVDSGASSVYVSVSCAFDDASGTSSCTFTPVDSSDGSVSGLTVPFSALCAPVNSTDAYEADGGLQGAGPVTISFDGSASAGGSATYAVDAAEGTITAPGDGLVCGDAPSDPESTVADPSNGTENQGADETGTPPGDASDQVQPLEIYQDQPTDEQTVVTDEGQADGTPEPVEIADVSVTVNAYDCTIDPGATPPSSVPECVPSVGVVVSGTADGVDKGTITTDAVGSGIFSVPDGSKLILVEDQTTIPSGFSPYGDGVATVTVTDGALVTFVHLQDPLLGRLQIVNGSCPTSGESRTEFRVIEPKSVAAAEAPACQVTGGTVFTITGGALAADLTVTTGSDGAWRGFLPAGTYTVIDDSGESADVTVVLEDISVVIVVDYVAHPLGVLNISRFTCKNAEQEGVLVSVHGHKPSIGSGDDCSPDDGSVTIDLAADVSAASVATVDLGADGVEEIELDPGKYVVTDTASGETTTVAIHDGQRIWAVIQESVVGGNGVGEPGDGNGNPGGQPGGGTGNSGGTPGDGTGGSDNGAVGGADGDGSGDDVGTVTETGSELNTVTSLPDTGSRAGNGGGQDMMFVLFALASGLAVGAVALTRSRARRVS